MSHIINTINSKPLDTDGATTLSVNEVNDITLTTPAAGQALKYDGSGWVNDDVAGSYDLLSYGLTNGVAHGNLASGFYSSFLTVYETPFFLAMRYKEYSILMNNYDTSNILVYQKQINVNAIYDVGFTVEANVNCLLCVDMVQTEVDPAGTYVDVQWQTITGTALGPIVRTISKGYNRQTIYGFISTSAQTIVGLKRVGNSASFGCNQSTETRQECIFAAREVG